jgi:hypothetical protein
MFRADLPARHGSYREGPFPEDYELWLRWMEAGVRFAKVPRVLLRWHDPPRRLSRTDARYDTEAFYRCKAPFLARWLRKRDSPSQPIIIWGAGRPTRKRSALLVEQGITITGYIDIDPKKQGRKVSGCPVMAPGELPGPGQVFVIGYVGKRGARLLARDFLNSRGWIEGRDFIMAA